MRAHECVHEGPAAVYGTRGLRLRFSSPRVSHHAPQRHAAAAKCLNRGALFRRAQCAFLAARTYTRQPQASSTASSRNHPHVMGMECQTSEPPMPGLGIPGHSNGGAQQVPVPPHAKHKAALEQPEGPKPERERQRPQPSPSDERHQPRKVLRVLDLYSGIGGMHHALQRVLRLEASPSAPEPESDARAATCQRWRAGNGLRGGDGEITRDNLPSNQCCNPYLVAPPRQKQKEHQEQGEEEPLLADVTAVDINTLANMMYAAEFRSQPLTLDLQRVTAAQLDLVGADLWLLTPPCQPHTRTSNARRRDTSDPRAASLLHLLSPSVFSSMKRPPSLLILENVPGFVGSDSHGIFRSTLEATNYDLQEFVVSPHQLGVPYSRPRYFALGVRRPLRFTKQYDSLRAPIEHPPDLPPHLTTSATTTAHTYTHTTLGSTTLAGMDSATVWPEVYGAGHDAAYPYPKLVVDPDTLPTASEWVGEGDPTVAAADCVRHSRPQPHTRSTLACFLTSIAPATDSTCQEGTEVSSLNLLHSKGRNYSNSNCSGRDNYGDSDPWVAYAVTAAQLARFWRVLDVVTPSSTYCNCFTKHYADNLLGAGSVLASEDFAARFCTRDARGRLHFAAPLPLPRQQPHPQLVAATVPDGAQLSAVGAFAVVPPNASSASRNATATAVYTDDADDGCGNARREGHLNNEWEVHGGVRQGRAGDGAFGTPPADDVQQRRLQPDGIQSSESSTVPVMWRRQPRGSGSGALGHSGRAAGRPCSDLERRARIGQMRQKLEDDESGALNCCDAEDVEAVVLGLRFFSPVEVAAIHGLPVGWSERATSAGLSARQQYGLLGNGLSVDVASYLLRHLLAAQPDSV